MAKILVVDDEPGVRSFVKETLVRVAHQVEVLSDGQAAKTMLERESFDLIITDLRMPLVSGTELLLWLKDRAIDPVVLVLSGAGTIESAVQCMRLGAFDFLEKPLRSPDQIRLAVSRALDSKRQATRIESHDRQKPLRFDSFPSEAMQQVLSAASKVSAKDTTLLIRGESGTGKEWLAQKIHQDSGRTGAFVALNCAALPDDLVESEIFGHEKGAFTGAIAQRRGRIELANDGTLLLDEVGELSPRSQAKLLRVLQEKTFERVGGTRTHGVTCRFIAATHRDLDQMVKDGTFREDLFHRLSVFPLTLPPLRQRQEDVPVLVDFWLRALAAELGLGVPSVHPAAKEMLLAYSWPGNLRELRNVLERALLLASPGMSIEPAHIVLGHREVAGDFFASAHTLREIEERAIRAALTRQGGNRRKAADELGIGLRTLYDKLKLYGLTSCQFSRGC